MHPSQIFQGKGYPGLDFIFHLANIPGNGALPSRSRDGGGKNVPEVNPEELWGCPGSWLWLLDVSGSLIPRAKRCSLKFTLDPWIWVDPSWELPQSSFSLCTPKPLGWVPPSQPCSLCLGQDLPHGSEIQPRSLFLQESPHQEIFLQNCTQSNPTHPLEASEFPISQGIVVFPPKG